MFKISDIIEINGTILYTVFADYDSKPWELIKNLDIILYELNISGTNYREKYEYCIDKENLKDLFAEHRFSMIFLGMLFLGLAVYMFVLGVRALLGFR